jgi:hypothetical protein
VASSQIVKSVSLTPHTAMIVDDVLPSGKFSAFVRECLVQYEATMRPDSGSCLVPHRRDQNLLLCNPIHKNAKCLYCWPHGVPSADKWKLYQLAPIISASGYTITRNEYYADEEWIQEEAKKNNPYKIDFENYDQLLIEQAKKTKKTAKVGVIRRFVRWIY